MGLVSCFYYYASQRPVQSSFCVSENLVRYGIPGVPILQVLGVNETTKIANLQSKRIKVRSRQMLRTRNKPIINKTTHGTHQCGIPDGNRVYIYARRSARSRSTGSLKSSCTCTYMSARIIMCVDSSSTTTQAEEQQESDPPTQVNFQDQPNMKGVSVVERDKPLDDDREELYRLHVRTGHLSFSKLRAMAQS
jgi:hypothetical protein